MRYTKIIATVGPSCQNIQVMRDMVEAGVDVFRLNFSHGTHEEHAQSIEMIRNVQAENAGIKPAILIDLQGPKVRIGEFEGEGYATLSVGSDFELSLDQSLKQGNDQIVGIIVPLIVDDATVGKRLLLDDGNIILEVIEKRSRSLKTKVIAGGKLHSKKGINFQGGGLTAESFTSKDQEDLSFALSFDIDFVAMSFVKTSEDIIKLKSFIQDHNSSASIIAKIERAEAVERIDAIAEVSDGLMIARGDLALEVGLAKVPYLQKKIIKTAKRFDCFSIVATQMMESMIGAMMPTRAEVSDIVNATIDQADALMLSAETAMGEYPVEVIKQMANISCADQKFSKEHEILHQTQADCDATRILALNGCQVAVDLLAKAMVVYTEKGRTALFASMQKMHLPIYALSQQKKTCLRLNILHGIIPVCVDFSGHQVSSLNRLAVETLTKQMHISDPDTVVILKGDLVGVSGHTNSLEVWTVADLLKVHESLIGHM